MTTNHGKGISFYDRAAIFATAYLKTETPEKAVNGIRSCGLWPYDDNIFSDKDFTAAHVTEEAEPIQMNHNQTAPVTLPSSTTAAPGTDPRSTTSAPET